MEDSWYYQIFFVIDFILREICVWGDFEYNNDFYDRVMSNDCRRLCINYMK